MIAAGDVRVRVTTEHIHHPGKWVMRCEPWFYDREIADDDLPAESAQRLALDAVREKIKAAHDAFFSLRAANPTRNRR